jgi:hypothetical protein
MRDPERAKISAKTRAAVQMTERKMRVTIGAIMTTSLVLAAQP